MTIMCGNKTVVIDASEERFRKEGFYKLRFRDKVIRPPGQFAYILLGFGPNPYNPEWDVLWYVKSNGVTHYFPRALEQDFQRA